MTQMYCKLQENNELGQILVRVTSLANQMQAFSQYFIRKKCLVQFGWILFAVKSNEKWKNGLDSTWISVILIQEYVHFIILIKKYEECVKFALISMDKVQMGHMSMWVLKCNVNVFL